MSMQLMVKAMNLKVGNPLRKLVLLKLADNASDTGECWPSYQHIAEQCEISRRSVINHIDAMCEAGLLTKESRVGPKGKRSNVYVLTLDVAGAALGGGAGDACPEVQEIHQGGAGDALGGGAGDAHRISHSFEPVIEPVIPLYPPRGKNHSVERVYLKTGLFPSLGGSGR
ncbi:helix-turn-helix domain-containing protein [Aeromonas veronii]